jgi:hypothetical protein
MKRDGVRVPFVCLSGRWLEAFDFKEGAKFTAIGVEGGAVRSSRRGASSGSGAADDPLSPRKPA